MLPETGLRREGCTCAWLMPGSSIRRLNLSFPDSVDPFGDPQGARTTNVVDPINRVVLNHALMSNKLAFMLDLPKVVASIIKNAILKHSRTSGKY